MKHVNELFARAKALCDARFEIEVQLMMLYQQMGETEKATQCKKFINKTIAREKASFK